MDSFPGRGNFSERAWRPHTGHRVSFNGSLQKCFVQRQALHFHGLGLWGSLEMKFPFGTLRTLPSCSNFFRQTAFLLLLPSEFYYCLGRDRVGIHKSVAGELGGLSQSARLSFSGSRRGDGTARVRFMLPTPTRWLISTLFLRARY